MRRGLHAAFTRVVGALDLTVELDAEAGTTVAVLGPNGAGKTTMLRVLAGLAAPDSGVVELDGARLVDTTTATWTPPEDRAVAVVFQDHLLFPHLSVRENVAFGLRSRGAGRREARAAADGWLARVGLAGRAGDRPGVLSGGEAQRVALARALATSPRLLLLDEPLSALDVTTRLAVRRDLGAFLAGQDGVRVLVTHDPLEAMALGDRLVILEGGRIVQQGTAADLVAQPRTPYVADLVGVNLLAGRAEGGLVTFGVGVHLAFLGDERGEVFAVIHPRAVSLHRDAPEGSPRNVWPGEAVAVDLEGDRARVVVALGGATAGDAPVLVAEVTLAAVDELHLAGGGRVWATVKATEVAVYPR